MSARERILERVRGGAIGRAAHPGAYRAQGSVPDWEAFASALRAVGGEAVGPLSRAELGDGLRALSASAGGGRICAPARLAAELGPGPWQAIPEQAEPSGLADVEVAILRGTIGVVENGAVGLEGRHAAPRALAFLCSHLVLLLDLDGLVADMHAAIARMPADATAHHHFTWVSGPSKTADIEQTLVLGAHGPRRLSVVGIAHAA